MSEEKFVVDQRAVRDRLKKLEAWHKRKMAQEEKESGISPEFTELDQAMDDIVDRTKEAQEELAAGNEKNQKCAQKETITAEDIRKRSMVSIGETKEREKENISKKQRRRDCLEYFKEIHEKETDLKREEIELKKREMAIREQEVANALAIKVKEEERKSKELKLKKRMKIRMQEIKVIWLLHCNNSYNNNKLCFWKCSNKTSCYWSCSTMQKNKIQTIVAFNFQHVKLF